MPECHEANHGVTDAKCLDCHDTSRSRMNWPSTAVCMRISPGRVCAAILSTRARIQHHRLEARGGHESFVHTQTGFSLLNDHAKVACTACHTRRMKSGRITYLGLSTDCRSCHKGVHGFTEAALAQKCDTCHPLVTSCAACCFPRGWNRTGATRDPL